MRAVGAAILVMVSLAPSSPARAAETVGPGGGGPRPTEGGIVHGCEERPCGLIQTKWWPEPQHDPAGQPALPRADRGVIVRWRFWTYEHPAYPGGEVGLRIVHAAQPFTLVRSAPPVTVTGGQHVDVPVRVPIGADETVAISLPFTVAVYGVNGDGNQGESHWVEGDDAAAYASATWGPYVDGFQFDVTIEPDADADGFGDETQDGCPGAPGQDAGCASSPGTREGPGPGTQDPATHDSLISGVRWRRRALRIELADHAALRVALRTGGGEVVRVVRRAGVPGVNVIRLRGRRVRRAVIRATDGAGRRERVRSRRRGTRR